MKRPNIKRRSDLIKLFRKYKNCYCYTSKYNIVYALLSTGTVLYTKGMSRITPRYGSRVEEIRDLISPYGYDVLVERVGKSQTFMYRIVKTWKGLTW
jgi:hypothetical protein